MTALLREADVRLLTLVGPGGVGKTRLAVAVAEATMNDFPGGVRFVDLAPVTDPALVLTVIARGFGLHDLPVIPPDEALADYLCEHPALLVLDNLEHLLPAAPALETLLAESPCLKVLATSRAPLNLRRERLVEVPHLSVPAPGYRAEDLVDLERTPAVAFFVDRARAADSGFALTSENAAAVAELVRRLDGLPLALELAAARTRLLEPAALVARVEHALALLRWDASDAPPRQRSLRATLDWSHALLRAEEQAVFRRLAVFAGGFGIDAAIEVAAQDTRDVEPLDLLAALTDQHLIRLLPDGAGEPRFVLPDTVREYAQNHLAASGEEAETRARHFSHFLTWAEHGERTPRTNEQVPWSNQLLREEANLRSALDWAISHGTGVDEWRLVAALWFFWWVNGRAREGAERVEAALSRPPANAEPTLLARLLEGAGVLADWSGNDERALAALEAALDAARRANDPGMMSRVLWQMHRLAYARGDAAGGRRLAEEMLVLAQAAGDQPELGWTLTFRVLFAIGPHGSAAERARLRGELAEATASARADKDRIGFALLLVAQGRLLAEVDLTASLASLRAGLELAREVDAPFILGLVWWLAGVMLMDRVSPDRAARLVAVISAIEAREAANGARSTIEVYGATGDRDTLDRAAATARQALGEVEFAAIMAAGAALSVPEIVDDFLAAIDAVAEQPAPGAARADDLLSPREREVLALAIAGRSNKEIAEALFVSPNTAKTHVASLLHKLDADNRHQLARIASERGLLDS